MKTTLAQIYQTKLQEVAQRQSAQPLGALRTRAEAAPPPLDFLAALSKRQPGSEVEPAWPALIAEIKFASPSKGVLRTERDPLALARCFQQNGAAAISVLTDETYFQGSLEILAQVVQMQPGLPVLRKDFLLDPYQVYEARTAGAAAVLLIVAFIDNARLQDLHRLANELGLAVLVEVHTAAELERALDCSPHLVGINHRDLNTFQIDSTASLRLRPLIPSGILTVAESGIRSRLDVRRLAQAGLDAILVGETLVTAPDTAAKVRELAA